MIASDRFTASFGRVPDGSPDRLASIVRAAVRNGFAVVVNKPGTKEPMCTLNARERKQADVAAQEAARTAGAVNWADRKHACGFRHAITDEAAAGRIVKRLVSEWGRVNLGIEVGRSRVLHVDTDTAEERKAFLAAWSAATGQDMSGRTPTVLTPGKVKEAADGTEQWVHKDGGHFCFELPEGVDLAGLPGPGALTGEGGWVASWRDHHVMVPPSVRAEGPYELVSPMEPVPAWLLERVQATAAAYAERKRLQAEQVRFDNDPIDGWATRTPWADLLVPDGFVDTGRADTCGCQIWTAPGLHASPKSATAHELGCAHYDMSSGHGPLHMWTDNPPEFLHGAKTVTKLQYVARRDHGGDHGEAMNAIGLEALHQPTTWVDVDGEPEEAAGQTATAEEPAGEQASGQPSTAAGEQQAAGQPAAPTRPVIADAALHGLAGRVVHTLGRCTEADPVAVLFVFLAMAGCYFGGGAHIVAGGTRHPGRIWPILTGNTSSGKKGTAVAIVRGLFERIDQLFVASNVAGGLSTSEGLIKRVRDMQGDMGSTKDFDPGVTDKRLLVIEQEFASVLSRARREGNSISETLRDAYDGVTMQTLVSRDPLRSTGHHIVVLSAITPQELIAKLSATDVANGFANRFMIVHSHRSKSLPEDIEPDEGEVDDIVATFQKVADTAAQGSRMRRTEAARKLWAEEYNRREARDLGDGPIAAMCARWAAHAARLSVIYALLDGHAEVDEVHVRAGLAAWDYSEASMRHVFADEAADRDLGRVMEFVNEEPTGRSRTEISSTLFKRHKSAAELDTLLDKLLATGRYTASLKQAVGQKGGRPVTVYTRR